MRRQARFHAQVWPSFAGISYAAGYGTNGFRETFGFRLGALEQRRAPLISENAPRRFGGRNRIERKGRADESCRRGTVGVAADLFRSFPVHVVLECPLGREDGDDRASGLFGLGLGNRDR